MFAHCSHSLGVVSFAVDPRPTAEAASVGTQIATAAAADPVPLVIGCLWVIFSSDNR